MPAICAGRKENLHTSRRSHGKIRWDDGCPPTSKNIAKKYLSTLIIRDKSKYLGRVPTIADRRGKIRSYDGSLRMTPPCHLQWSNLHPMPKIIKEAGPVILATGELVRSFVIMTSILSLQKHLAMVESSPCRRSIHLCKGRRLQPVITRPLLIAEARFVRMMAPYG